jgi:hypothetical protein
MLRVMRSGAFASAWRKWDWGPRLGESPGPLTAAAYRGHPYGLERRITPWAATFQARSILSLSLVVGEMRVKANDESIRRMKTDAMRLIAFSEEKTVWR